MFVSIDCDDVHPLNCNKDGVGYTTLELLNDMGYKPTVFVPANWHGIADLRNHKKWLNDIKTFCEVQAHGLHHRGFFGDCEFHTSFTQLEAIMENMMEIWKGINYIPTVLRPPGWNHVKIDYSKYIKHLAVHDDEDSQIQLINIHNLVPPTKEFVILHSHIDSGDNDLSKPKLFKNMCSWLDYYDLKYITVGEMYDKKQNRRSNSNKKPT